MTNEQILKKAIKKASENGYPPIERWGSWRDIVFDHKFAKAFWPGNQYCISSECISLRDPEEGCDCTDGPRHKLYPTFLYHLREMVIEEDPIKYLEQFLD